MDKFIITNEKNTATSLIAAGFKLVSHIGSTYTFVNQTVKNFNFDSIDKKTYYFSNILSM